MGIIGSENALFERTKVGYDVYVEIMKISFYATYILLFSQKKSHEYSNSHCGLVFILKKHRR